MPRSARHYAWSVIASGGMVFAAAMWNWASPNPRRFFIYLALALVASIWKFRLPKIPGTYSASFLLTLVGIVSFTLPETLTASCAGALVQSVWRPKQRPSAVQILFSMANLALSIGLCFLVARAAGGFGLEAWRPAGLALLAALHFFTSTMLVSGVLSLLQGKPLRLVCQQWYEWFLPFYLIGAVVVGLLPLSDHVPAPEGWLILLPLLYLVHFFCAVSSGRRSSCLAAAEPPGQMLSRTSQFYIDLVISAGATLLIYALSHWQCQDLIRFMVFLAIALVAATFKVRLPGLTSTMSFSFVLILVAIAELTFAETIGLAAMATVVQIIWRPLRSPSTLEVAFNAACTLISVSIAFMVWRALMPTPMSSMPSLLITGTIVLYSSNILIVAAVMCLAERKPLWDVFQQYYFWSFPYYAVGASVSGLMIATSRSAGWHLALTIFPVLALVYVSYRLHTVRSIGREVLA